MSAHLSEFYTLLNKEATTTNNATSYLSEQQPNSDFGLNAFQNASIQHKPSITSLRTASSAVGSVQTTDAFKNHPHLPAIISSRQVSETLRSYSALLSAAGAYRQALQSVSVAAAEFGKALEECAQCPGAGCSEDALHTAGGLQYLISNHYQILSRSVEQDFELPVQREVQAFGATMASNHRAFKTELEVKARELKVEERENAKLARLKTRNLVAYKSSLLNLTGKIDEIEQLKYSHYSEAYDIASGTSRNILGHTATVVRSEVDICENIARKGWTGGGLETVLSEYIEPANRELDLPVQTSPTVKEKGVLQTIHGLFSPGALKTAPAKTLKPKLSLNFAKPVPSDPQPQRTVVAKRSLFSILPSKSIFPRFGDKEEEANETVTYDSGKGIYNAEKSSILVDTSLSTGEFGTPRVGSTSLSSSFSSAFENHLSTSTPIYQSPFHSNTKSPSRNTVPFEPPEPLVEPNWNFAKGKHVQQESVSKWSPHHLMSDRTSAAGPATVYSTNYNQERHHDPESMLDNWG